MTNPVTIKTPKELLNALDYVRNCIVCTEGMTYAQSNILKDIVTILEETIRNISSIGADDPDAPKTGKEY